MGFFGSNTVEYYNSASSLLFADVPSLVSQTVKVAITQNRNIASDLIVNLTNGIGFKANSLYNYSRVGGYHYGLPEGSRGLLPPNTYNDIKIVIAADIEAQVHVLLCTINTDPVSGNYTYYAEYNLLDEDGEDIIADPLIWTYDESSHVYPLLDIPLITDINASPYFPIIPMRVDSQSTVAEGQPYKTDITRAASFLGIDVAKISEGIEAQEGDNPVEDAFIVLAVDITNKSQEGMEYLFEYFKQIQTATTIDKLEYEYWQALPEESKGTPAMNYVRVTDSNYEIELGWLYAETTVHDGVIAEVGKFTSTYAENEGDQHLTSTHSTTTTTYSTNSITLRKQINQTQYTEVEVVGLVHTSWVVGHLVRNTLEDAFADPTAAQSFAIPLRKDIFDQMGAIKCHDLCYQAIRLVVNDKLTVKLKWYQTGLFQVIILIVAIVFSWVTSGLSLAAWAAIELPILLVKMVLMRLLMPVAIKALEDLVGEELALLVTVVASIYFGGGSTGSYLSAGMQAVSGIASIKFKDAMQDIMDELDSVNADLEDLLEVEHETKINVLSALSTSKADSYNIMTSVDYVRRFHYMSKEPLLINDLTHQFTNVLKETDRPNSYIRLGNTLT